MPKTRSLVILALLVAAVIAGASIFKWCGNESEQVTSGDLIKPSVEKPITRSENVVPPTMKADKVRGRLRITFKDTVGTTPEKKPIVVERQIDVLIPKDDEPPVVQSPNAEIFKVEYSDFRDPWLKVKLKISVGAVAGVVGPSPALEVGVITLFENLRLGALVDKFGVGPSASIAFWRDWAAVGKLNLLPFRSGQNISIGVMFRI